MSVYEFTFLLNEKQELKNLKSLVTEVGGKVTKEEEWGNKRLSYPIKKQEAADFYNWQVEFSEEQVNEFRKKLQFNTKILRHLLLKVS